MTSLTNGAHAPSLDDSTFVIDSEGLYQFSKTTDNYIRDKIYQIFQQRRVVVLTYTWEVFSGLMPEEASQIKNLIGSRRRADVELGNAVVEIRDRHAPYLDNQIYDDEEQLYVAGYSNLKDATILTAHINKRYYPNLGCAKYLDLSIQAARNN